jgi:hypothetical protein
VSMRVVRGHSLGRQYWGDPMKVASRDAGSQEGVIVTSHITFVYEWVCSYIIIVTSEIALV